MRGTKGDDGTHRKTEEQDRGTCFPQFPACLVPRGLKIPVMVPIYLCLSSLWDVWRRIHQVFRHLPRETFLWACRIRSILGFYTIWKVAFDLNVLHLASVEALQSVFCPHTSESCLVPPDTNAGFVCSIHQLNLHVQIRKALGM